MNNQACFFWGEPFLLGQKPQRFGKPLFWIKDFYGILFRKIISHAKPDRFWKPVRFFSGYFSDYISISHAKPDRFGNLSGFWKLFF
jgi:hypothetical protein